MNSVCKKLKIYKVLRAVLNKTSAICQRISRKKRPIEVLFYYLKPYDTAEYTLKCKKKCNNFFVVTESKELKLFSQGRGLEILVALIGEFN